MNTLTPQEVLQALIDGVKLEYKPRVSDAWHEFDIIHNQLTIRTLFSDVYDFRIYQATVTVGNVSFPKPESEPLELGTEYWRVEPSYMHYAISNSFTWADDSYDNMYLKRGLVHLSRENAVAHTNALIKLSGGKVDD